VVVTGLRHLINATDDEAWMLEAGLASLSVDIGERAIRRCSVRQPGSIAPVRATWHCDGSSRIGRGRSPATRPSSKQSRRSQVAR